MTDMTEKTSYRYMGFPFSINSTPATTAAAEKPSQGESVVGVDEIDERYTKAEMIDLIETATGERRAQRTLSAELAQEIFDLGLVKE